MPATAQPIKPTNTKLVYANFSTNSIPLVPSADTPVTSTFTRHIRKLVGSGTLPELKEAILADSLTIIVDGSFNPISKQASYSWVLTAHGQTTITEGSSQITLGPKSAYRAELMAIYAATTILTWVEEVFPDTKGTITLISDCDKAIRRAFRQGPIGIKDATQDEYDLVLAIRQQNQELQTKILPQWTPGHPTAADPRGEQVKNTAAHALAVKRLQSPLQTGYDDSYIADTEITVLHHSTPITSGLPHLVTADIHYEPLKSKLQKDNTWTDATFNKVDWTSFHQAIISLPRPRRLSISKLSHGLWNINTQNHKYYGHSNKCPNCAASETMEHIFICQSDHATSMREEAIATFTQSMQESTPQILLDLLVQLLRSSDPPQAAQQVLQSAAEDQHSIGWQNIFRGHLSLCWKTAYQHLLPVTTKQPNQQAALWCKRLIRALWTYSLSLWYSRNLAVHGLTNNAAVSKAIRLLKEEVKQHYRNHVKDSHIVKMSRAFLFEKPLPIMLQLPRQQLACWLSSVQEAIKSREFADEVTQGPQQELMQRFLQPRQQSIQGKQPQRNQNRTSLERQSPTISQLSVSGSSPKGTTKTNQQTRGKLQLGQFLNVSDHSKPKLTLRSRTQPGSNQHRQGQQPPSPRTTKSLPVQIRPTPGPVSKRNLAPRNSVHIFPITAAPNTSVTKPARIKAKTAGKPTAPTGSETPKSRRQYPNSRLTQRTLLNYGFIHKQLRREQQDREAEKIDYSGSLVSTAP